MSRSVRERFREEGMWLDLEPPQGLAGGAAVIHREDSCRDTRNLIHPHELPDDAELCPVCWCGGRS